MTKQTWAQARRGFTIAELLIVITVIAIIAAIVTVSYNGITASSREAAYISDLKKYSDIIESELALAKAGPYSSSLPQLVAYTCLGAPESYPATERFTAGSCVLMGDAYDPIDATAPYFEDRVGGSKVFDSSKEAIMEGGGPYFAVTGIRGVTLLLLQWGGISSPAGSAYYIAYTRQSSQCIGNDIYASELNPGHPTSSGEYMRGFGTDVCMRLVDEDPILN